MLFLGCLFDREKEKEIMSLSNSGLMNASNTFEWNLIDGLSENLKKPVDIINVLPVGTYPKSYKKLFLKTFNWSYKGSRNTEIGCINLPFIKQFMRTVALKQAIKQKNDKNIIIYSTYLPFLKAIKNLDKSYHITLIVTDLPEYYDLAKISGVRRVLRNIYNKMVYKCLERVDDFVILTEQMKEPLKIGRRRYVVVEGISNSAEFPKDVEKSDKKAILYTGTLNYKFGIKTLLDAFLMIQGDEYELWICGSGEAKEEIEHLSKKDKRIKYFGYLPKEEIQKLQKSASLLINPRSNEGEYTKYSFPSKTIEYMQSSTPVLMHKLAGIPEEYSEYLYYFEGNTKDDVKNKIIEILGKTKEERAAFGENARRFIIDKKNPAVQAGKILKLIGENLN